MNIKAKVQILRGLKDSLPVLNSGELAFATDTNELFIGDPNDGNVLINTNDRYDDTVVKKDIARLSTQLGNIVQKEKYKYIDDNITDLSTFFQNIDDKYIYIKEGNYIIGDVTLIKDVNIEFHEKAIVSLKNDSSYIFKFQNCENVSIKGKFVGDFLTDIDLLSFENVNNLNLNLDISNCGRKWCND